LDKDKLIVTPVSKLKPALDQLLTKITKENLQHEIDTGNAAGNEL
jgi:antitoxin component of MazEF toxin-antitoxin module